MSSGKTWKSQQGTLDVALRGQRGSTNRSTNGDTSWGPQKEPFSRGFAPRPPFRWLSTSMGPRWTPIGPKWNFHKLLNVEFGAWCLGLRLNNYKSFYSVKLRNRSFFMCLDTTWITWTLHGCGSQPGPHATSTWGWTLTEASLLGAAPGSSPLGLAH